jgi:hypothetical protein
MTVDGVLKLADFGLAVDTRAERANTRSGTPVRVFTLCMRACCGIRMGSL